jgi:hypothetical protein
METQAVWADMTGPPLLGRPFQIYNAFKLQHNRMSRPALRDLWSQAKAAQTAVTGAI